MKTSSYQSAPGGIVYGPIHISDDIIVSHVTLPVVRLDHTRKLYSNTRQTRKHLQMAAAGKKEE